MIWPWNKHRLAVQNAHQQAIDAARQAQAAEDRRRAVEQLIGQSSATSARLRREIARNGFSDLLQQAWGRK